VILTVEADEGVGIFSN